MEEAAWEPVTELIATHTAARVAEAKRDGSRLFPGFSLREDPPRVQRLGFGWLDEKKQHRYIEFSNYDTHPFMVANQLRGLAEALEEAHGDPKSPLGRAAARTP
jgi:hypothetical protein